MKSSVDNTTLLRIVGNLLNGSMQNIKEDILIFTGWVTPKHMVYPIPDLKQQLLFPKDSSYTKIVLLIISQLKELKRYDENTKPNLLGALKLSISKSYAEKISNNQIPDSVLWDDIPELKDQSDYDIKRIAEEALVEAKLKSIVSNHLTIEINNLLTQRVIAQDNWSDRTKALRTQPVVAQDNWSDLTNALLSKTSDLLHKQLTDTNDLISQRDLLIILFCHDDFDKIPLEDLRSLTKKFGENIKQNKEKNTLPKEQMDSIEQFTSNLLFILYKSKKIKAVLFLLKDNLYESLGIDLNKTYEQGQTLLHCALLSFDEKMVKVLLKLNVNTAIKTFRLTEIQYNNQLYKLQPNSTVTDMIQTLSNLKKDILRLQKPNEENSALISSIEQIEKMFSEKPALTTSKIINLESEKNSKNEGPPMLGNTNANRPVIAKEIVSAIASGKIEQVLSLPFSFSARTVDEIKHTRKETGLLHSKIYELVFQKNLDYFEIIFFTIKQLKKLNKFEGELKVNILEIFKVFVNKAIQELSNQMLSKYSQHMREHSFLSKLASFMSNYPQDISPVINASDLTKRYSTQQPSYRINSLIQESGQKIADMLRKDLEEGKITKKDIQNSL